MWRRGAGGQNKKSRNVTNRTAILLNVSLSFFWKMCCWKSRILLFEALFPESFIISVFLSLVSVFKKSFSRCELFIITSFILFSRDVKRCAKCNQKPFGISWRQKLPAWPSTFQGAQGFIWSQRGGEGKSEKLLWRHGNFVSTEIFISKKGRRKIV